VAEETFPLIVNPQSTDDIKTTAEYFRRGLILGLHSVANALAWIDMILITEPTPDIAIIEASLCGSRGPIAVAEWLAYTPGVFDKRTVARRLLGAMHVWLSQDRAKAAKVAHWLYQMALDGDTPDGVAEERMWYFDDAFGLATDGVYGNAEELCEELIAFLAQYDRHTG
jgi:hypothetical protein